MRLERDERAHPVRDGPEIRVGISGWRYPSWRGAFYPAGLVQRRELAYVATQLSTVEVNGSFYSLLRPETFTRWSEETPSDFVFALKGSRYITHMLRLAGAKTALANFFASGVLALGAKLGPVLWQLPERFAFDRARVAELLALLPRSHDDAARLARRHDARVAGRALVRARHEGAIRHALEPRHPSFASPELAALCAEHGVAIVMADTAGRFPMFEEPAVARFVYVRLHGSEELYASGYREDELRDWSRRARRWQREGRDVFVYFDNDVRGHAPFDAMTLDALARGRRSTHARPISASLDAEQPRTAWPAWTKR
jgi:uncharacterized protein YecE (DUF72 family)